MNRLGIRKPLPSTMKRISTLLIWTLMVVMNQPASAQDGPEIGYFNLSSGGGKVYLAWQLKAGGTCFGIQVHRSADGLNFEKIGGIEGVCGDLNNPESYSFTDDDPPLNQRVYYRLELGLGNFTEIRYVDVTDLLGELFQVRPHPVTTTSSIHFLNPQKENHTLIISDLQGRTIYRQTSREDHFTIQSSYFAKGLYLFYIASPYAANTLKGKLMILPQ